MFLAFNGHGSREAAEQDWQWRFVRDTEDEEHVEATMMSAALLAGALIISGAEAVFLIRLLA